MKTLILFYSYSGKTKAAAEKRAAESEPCIIEQVYDVKKPPKPIAFIAGCFKAMRRKKSAIKPIKSNPEDFDKIVIMAPIWAGHPAPAFNSIVELLPAGREVELVLTSAGGESKESQKGTEALIAARSCKVIKYIDIAVSD